MQGFIYVMTNPTMPGLAKVGMTARDPQTRLQELSRATGIASPFMLIYQQPVVDCAAAEKWVHAELERKGFRHADNREFFNAPVHEIVSVVSQSIDIKGPENTHAIFPEEPGVSTEELRALARKLSMGDGVPEDIEKALTLYEQAAILGDTKAAASGGNLARAQHTPKMYARALKLYERGFNSGALDLAVPWSYLLEQIGYTDAAASVWLQFFRNANAMLASEDWQVSADAQKTVELFGWNYFIACGRGKIRNIVPPSEYKQFANAFVDSLKQEQEYACDADERGIAAKAVELVLDFS